MRDRKQQIELDMEQQTLGKSVQQYFGKGVCQGCILSPCLFNFYAEYITRNAGLEEAQAGINGLTTSCFSSCGGILELGQEIQASSCVGPGKSSLLFELRGRARDCA